MIEAKNIAILLMSFLFTILLWDVFFRDFYFGMLVEGDYSLFEVGSGYLIIAFVFIGFYLLLNKRLTHEEESASEY